MIQCFHFFHILQHRFMYVLFPKSVLTAAQSNRLFQVSWHFSKLYTYLSTNFWHHHLVMADVSASKLFFLYCISVKLRIFVCCLPYHGNVYENVCSCISGSNERRRHSHGTVQFTWILVWLTAVAVTLAGCVGMPPKVVAADVRLIVDAKSLYTVSRYW